MPNASTTSLTETFPRSLTSTFENAVQTTAEPSQPPSKAHDEAVTTNLMTLLARTLGASRPDWRNQRITRTAYASSRVSYVEEEMTEEQSREFE